MGRSPGLPVSWLLGPVSRDSILVSLAWYPSAGTPVTLSGTLAGTPVTLAGTPVTLAGTPVTLAGLPVAQKPINRRLVWLLSFLLL